MIFVSFFLSSDIFFQRNALLDLSAAPTGTLGGFTIAPISICGKYEYYGCSFLLFTDSKTLIKGYRHANRNPAAFLKDDPNKGQWGLEGEAQLTDVNSRTCQ